MSGRQPTERMARRLREARRRTLSLLEDLDDDQLMGPRLPTVNPLLWEVGHLAWFQEKWCLRQPHGGPSLLAAADALYDSATVPHDSRWDLPLPDRMQTLGYMREVLDRVLAGLESGGGEDAEPPLYFHQLVLSHEDMHCEAFVINRQTLALPAPRLPARAGGRKPADGALPAGDADMPGGLFDMGARRGLPFVFDNEKWAHAVRVAPFRMAKTVVTQGEFAGFVRDGGYLDEEVWSARGREWLRRSGARHPVYWRPDGEGGWLERRFDRTLPLDEKRPVVNVCWFEAEAFCRWAGRRLPTEAEWEWAATAPFPGEQGRPPLPWGNAPPAAARASLDGGDPWCVEPDDLPDGDNAHGCRQLIGNVWEWTADDFLPYPGFEVDPYREYSQPWFGAHKVLRGGCWLTRSRLIRSTWRNFYEPDRRDVWAGFRTCAPVRFGEARRSES